VSSRTPNPELAEGEWVRDLLLLPSPAMKTAEQIPRSARNDTLKRIILVYTINENGLGRQR
jgi:hypothetical protein